MGELGKRGCLLSGWPWKAYTPQQGWQAWIEDESRVLVFDGQDWIAPSESTPTLGINTSANETNRLTVKSPASLFDNEAGDHRVVVNKAGETDTASMVFQSDYVGHAELGLMGDTHFAIKLSSDGSAFSTALVARHDSGHVGIGTAVPETALHLKSAVAALMTIEAVTAGHGAAFDLRNSADDQSWRITGQASKFKLRDHTAGLDKFEIFPGADGNILYRNCGNVGVNTTSPSTKLHVNGPVRIGSYTSTGLPDAAQVGAGTLIHVSDAGANGAVAFSDGADWRHISDSSLIT